MKAKMKKKFGIANIAEGLAFFAVVIYASIPDKKEEKQDADPFFAARYTCDHVISKNVRPGVSYTAIGQDSWAVESPDKMGGDWKVKAIASLKAEDGLIIRKAYICIVRENGDDWELVELKGA